MNNISVFASPKLKVQHNEGRANILNIAMKIIRTEGWEALSMRKIAAQLGYSATLIYQHFKNKGEIRIELVRKGFLLISAAMKKGSQISSDSCEQFEQMWLAYLSFAKQDKMLYRLMFSTGISEAEITKIAEVRRMQQFVIDILLDISASGSHDIKTADIKFFTIWAFTHGLVSISSNCRAMSEEAEKNILISQIRIMTASYR